MKSLTKRQKILFILSLVLLNIWITIAFHIVFDKNQELKYSLTILLSVIQIIIASQIDLNCSNNENSMTNSCNKIEYKAEIDKEGTVDSTITSV